MDGSYSKATQAEKVAHNMALLGHEWADRECAASLLEETRKSVRAQLAVEFLKDAGSAAKAELMAEADDKYVDHLNKMVAARKAANIARVNFDAHKAWIELVRSAEASRRAEMNIR